MDAPCKNQCILFMEALGRVNPPQLGSTLISMTIIWLIINSLLLNRWVLLQQYHSAQLLAARLMRLHLGLTNATETRQHQRAPLCHALLITGDPAYRHILTTVLGAKTFADQAVYTRKIDRLLHIYQTPAEGNTNEDAVERWRIHQANTRGIVLRDAPELIESLKLRRWRGMLMDPSNDIDLVLLILTQRTHLIALRRNSAVSHTVSHGI